MPVPTLEARADLPGRVEGSFDAVQLDSVQLDSVGLNALRLASASPSLLSVSDHPALHFDETEVFPSDSYLLLVIHKNS